IQMKPGFEKLQKIFLVVDEKFELIVHGILF
ncbi:MAG: hypothetical protein HW374_399, partial [Bacteroidetes bacterium]|nr:hypothetical protein [Bacteroidota bacterium]